MRRSGRIQVPREPITFEKPMSFAGRIEALGRRNLELALELRAVRRRERKLTERLNRVAKLAPGRHRINELYRIASEFDYEGDRAERLLEEQRTENPGQVPRIQAVVLTARESALFHRRLAYDLDVLRDEVRGDKRMPGSRNDPTMWRGERP